MDKHKLREQTARPERKTPPLPEGSPVVFVDQYLEKHITSGTLKPNIKRNPLYVDIKSIDIMDNEKFKPSWTIKEYDTQTIHGNLTEYVKNTKTPRDLDFWLEDLYTPGFDSLLKREEAEQRRKRLSKIVSSIVLLVCACLIAIIVPIVVFQRN
ncbi:major intrinsically disordered NOTCH2-binding receptor 1-like isoform X4 [Girardinichthys multiradiatus]|uniref:major intrinsically disordered NOTCH2-binding receptor 1-like isoform X4 n=1 Tax=Girardinichthys multiradiatus TaxID=208333 RepID=UPI001FAC1B6A|nr:major intrinsically disordered NOTCH2-binding receptor 1-like isoform X4 [Girardinichthys multiradiatus]